MNPQSAPIYEFGPYQLNKTERLLLHDGEPVPLTPKAFDLLTVLVDHRGHLMGKEELLEAVWRDAFVEEANLSYNISALRKALAESSEGRRYIETVPKRGYRFVADVRELRANEVDSNVNNRGGLIEGSLALGGSQTDETLLVSPPSEPDVPPLKPSRQSRSSILTQLRARPLLFIAVLFTAVMIVVTAAKFVWRRTANTPHGIHTVAVLPLKNLSGDSAHEYLCDGLTDSLITAFSKIDNLKVISRGSVFRFKDHDVDPREVGRQLGVDAAIEGSVRLEGQVAHVTVRMINTSDGSVLWPAETYDRTLANVSSLQDEIARNVAAGVSIKLSGESEKRLRGRYTHNVEAYEFYLKGRYFWNKRTAEDLERAIEYYQRSIERDPNYALAHMGLAEAYVVLNHYVYSPLQSAFPRAQVAAQRALELDDQLAEAQAVLAVVKYNYEWDWAGAEKIFQRAISLNPNYATAHQWYGECLLYQGKIDEGTAEMERAYELDPASLVINTQRGFAYLWGKQLDRAMDQFQKTLELEPNYSVALYGIGLLHEQHSRYDEAIAVYRRTASTVGFASLGYAYGVVGREREAREVLNQLQGGVKEKNVSPYMLAVVETGLGEKDQAMKYLEMCFETRDARLATVKTNLHFVKLRSDPRFIALERRMGLTP